MPENEYNKLKSSEIAANKKSSFKDPNSPVEPCELHWIEIELVGEDGKGIPDKNYLIIAPDGKQFEGKTDVKGLARIEGIAEGMCKISFPYLDKDAWETIN